MADNDSPTGSPLSDLSSEQDPFEADEDHDIIIAAMPPAKRQKIYESSLRATPHPTDDDALTFISSDTDGEVPDAPSNSLSSRLDDDEIHEQVTVCAWDGCDAGDLVNMDRLVEHIHNEHIETRLKKYTCEWSGCNRKTMQHASGYALKAHMRSHTREKPFYCALPECDRAFTRSDALAKHMRTVHETEALRPSDPIPKGMLAMKPVSLTSKLKIIIKDSQFPGPVNGTTNGNVPLTFTPNVPLTWTSSFPTDLGLTSKEEARGSKELWRLLRRQLHWAEEESESLKQSLEMMEDLRRKEWMEKEILLDQAIHTEIGWHERRKEVLAGLANLPTPMAIKAAADKTWSTAFSSQGEGMSPSPVPATGPPVEDQREAAAVLASSPQA